MIQQSSSLVHVFFIRDTQKCPMGRLLLKDRKIFFEYDADFVKTGLELSPFKLPLQHGVITSGDPTFEGLFGVFNDSLPDGWGRILLDRQLRKYSPYPHRLSPLDRLCFVGSTGMGALIYEPAHPEASSLPYEKDLDVVAEEVRQFQETDDDRFVEALLQFNGSSAGARPKIIMRYQDEDWLVKFRSSIDPKDIGNIEYAYHLMAKKARLDVPDAKLFPSRHSGGYFGVKRFDRCLDRRIHMHTASGLLHVDHREPSLDYEAIMKLTLYLTRDMSMCEKQFRATVFNILAYNRDDHSKNFSFLMDEKGQWSVSPAYDLTFSHGVGGEHCTTVMGEGRHPTRSHLMKLAEIVGIKKSKASEVLDEVATAASQWLSFAEEAGVDQPSRDHIHMALQQQLKNIAT